MHGNDLVVNNFLYRLKIGAALIIFAPLYSAYSIMLHLLSEDVIPVDL